MTLITNRVRMLATAVVVIAFFAAAPSHAAAAGLDWKPCTNSAFDRWQRIDAARLSGFDCAVFKRPLARGRPHGAQVRLAVVRLQASGPPAERKGTLFFNPGGPGSSGLGLAAAITSKVPPEILRSFDFVTWDPRGVGASTPAIKGPGCDVPMPTRPATGPVNWRRVLANRVEQVRRHNVRCFRRNRELVEHAGTRANAYDLEALRKAVGDPKLNYWGISYGTMLGSTYAQLFPEHVRAVVFDGNMDPQITLYGLNAGSTAPDHSIGFFLEANPSLRRTYHAVERRLRDHTLKLPDGTRYTRWDLRDVLSGSVPFYPSWPVAQNLIQFSYTALFGAGDAKQKARRELTNPEAQSPAVDSNAGGVFSAVLCQDFVGRLTHRQQRHGLDWAVREGPIYGGSLAADYLSVCNGYGKVHPHPVPRPKRYGPNIRGIVANATRDGETPYQWAVNMARTYRRMRMITLVSGIHGTFGLSESPCVDDPIARFLLSLQLPATDLTCPYSPPPSVP
jgi:pimeloyl-ACP methyl ester carboxylesterase